MAIFGSIFDQPSAIFDQPSIFDSPVQRALRVAKYGAHPPVGEYDEPSLPEQESLLSYLGGGLLSGAGFAGELLDKGSGARALRGLLGGHPEELLSVLPFSDTLGLTDRSNIVSGKDLTGYDDPNAYADDILGFVVEGALDPLLFASLGTGGAVSAGGKFARAAGVTGSEIAKAAAAKATAQAAARSSQTGARVAARIPGYLESQITTSIDDLFKYLPDTASRLTETAARQAVDIANPAIRNQPLSGLVGLNLPFQDPFTVLGTGPIGQRVARALDTANSSVYNAFPGKNPLPVMGALFHAPYRGTMTPEVQRIASEGFDAEEAAVYNANLKVADLHRRLERSKFFKGDNALKNELDFVAYVENATRPGASPLPPDVQAVADEMRQLLPQMLQDERKAGLISPELVDTFMAPDPTVPGGMVERRLDYLPRLPYQWADAPPHSFAATRPLDTTNPFTAHREDFLRGLPEGTAFLQELSLDPEISGIINRKKVPNGTVPRAAQQDVAAIIRRKYGPQFDELGVEIPGTNRLGEYGSDASKMRELVGFLATLDPRHAKQNQPFFAGPLQGLQGRYLSSNRAIAHANVLHDAILGSVKRTDEASFGESTRDVWRTLQDAPGIDPVEMGRKLEASLARLADQSGTLADFDALRTSAAASINEKRAILDGLELAKKEKRSIPKGLLDKKGNLKDPLPPELEPYVAYARDEQRLKPILSSYVMPRRLVDDATKLLSKWQVPPAVGWLEDASRRSLNAFKLGVTSLFPAFHARNYPSGQFNNVAAGAYRGVGDFLSDTNIADAVMQGRTVPGVAKVFAKQFGAGLTDDQTMDRLRDHVFAANLLDHGSALGQADVGGTAGHRLLDILSKDNPLTPHGGFAFDKNRTWAQAFPLNFMTMRGVGTAQDLNWYSKGMNQFGTYLEGQNRIAPFLGFLKQGVEPIEASRRAKRAQVDYSRATDFERRVMTQLFPFYKFTRGMAPFVADQLASHPSGLMAQTVRGAGRIERENEFVPDYLASTTRIPLGDDGEGNMRYLTGLGLAHENPLNLIRPGLGSYDTAQNAFGGVLGMLNPYLKLPIELATGTQLYSGRDLEDLDSTVGRIATNVGLAENPPDVPIVVDEVLANSPVARLLSTTRQATDERKWDPMGVTSILTGLRVTDVNRERAEQYAAREALEKLLRSDPAIFQQSPRLLARDVELLSPQERFAYQILGGYYQ